MQNLRTILFTLATVAFLLLLWISTPSSMFFRPVSWTYDQSSGEVTFQRDIKWFAPVRLNWQAQISSAAGTCFDNGSRLHDPKDYEVTYRIAEALKPCADGTDARGVLSWSVLVFGLIPLRPVYLNVPPADVAKILPAMPNDLADLARRLGLMEARPIIIVDPETDPLLADKIP